MKVYVLIEIEIGYYNTENVVSVSKSKPKRPLPFKRNDNRVEYYIIERELEE